MRKILTKYLLVWLTLTCILSFFWIRIPGTDRLPDPFDLSGSSMKILISMAMLVIGSLLPLDEVRMVVKRWPMIIAGTAVQFTAMPFLAFIAAKIFRSVSRRGIKCPRRSGFDEISGSFGTSDRF